MLAVVTTGRAGHAGLQVWAQTRGTQADFLVTPLQRGLSTVTFPAPDFCTDEPCAVQSGVTWPRLGPLGERPERGGPWPPPTPGAHVADIGVTRGLRNAEQLTFQMESSKGVLRASVAAPGPVEAGEGFQLSASVQACRRGTDVCGNSAGDVLVYVFAVDAAWAAAETQPPFVPDIQGPFPLASGSVRDIGRAVNALDFALRRVDRPIRFELPLATLLSLETERDLAQVRHHSTSTRITSVPRATSLRSCSTSRHPLSRALLARPALKTVWRRS